MENGLEALRFYTAKLQAATQGASPAPGDIPTLEPSVRVPALRWRSLQQPVLGAGGQGPEPPLHSLPPPTCREAVDGAGGCTRVHPLGFQQIRCYNLRVRCPLSKVNHSILSTASSILPTWCWVHVADVLCRRVTTAAC